MPSSRRAMQLLSLLIAVALLVPGFPAAAAPPAQTASIVIDGAKEEAWGDPLAADAQGDISEANLDLANLYVVEDADNYYIGFDAYASTWGMTYGIYLDTDQAEGSGATSDPWGRSVNAVSAHLPEHTLYVWHADTDALGDAQLNHWDGSAWSFDTLVSQGGEQAYGPDGDWVEYKVPKAALGSPERIALELFTTGGDGHAQDTVPSDPNVDFAEPDWTAGNVTTLSAFALFPPPPPPAEPVWYVASDWNGWDPADPGNALYDDGSHGDVTAGDGVHTGQFTIATAGRYGFKVTKGSWDVSYPGANSWLDTTTGGETVAITFDTKTHDGGWQPTTNIIGVSSEPGAWTATGDWQGWDNANPATAMAPQGDGIYRLETTISTPGSHEFKATKTGTWDAVGPEGRSENAGTLAFTTTAAGQGVTFWVNALAGRIKVEVAPPPPSGPALDNDIWWAGLGHDSRSDLYRVPGGAVTTGTPVTIRFRTFHGDVSAVTLRLWSTAVAAQTVYPMEKVATTAEGEYGYDYWQATLPAQSQPTVLYYRFIVRDGADEDYYEDDDLFDGGWGTTYDVSPDYSFQIDVYDPAFQTPDWMKNAVVYQIFPDRFFNGDRKNDPRATDPDVYGQPVLVKQWTALPEGYCRNYVGAACDEQPLGRDFFGGDLAGITKKLGYLKGLGVTALYLNPIFMAPSNHLYDTTDYGRIDPYLGNNASFADLVDKANKMGMRIILDGVFNHTSSDSVYFDKYDRYDASTGAYESQESGFYPWYTFYDWPESYNSWWGFDSMPVLTETDPVRSFIYGAEDSIARTWIERGAAGWRLDVAPDKSHQWWEGFRPQVKSADPEAVIVGEIWDDASEWLLGDEFDSTMNYRFRRALVGFILGQDYADPNQGTIRGLTPDQFDGALQSIKEDYPAPAYAALMNLVDSHDTQRILWTLTPGARNDTEKESPANLGTGEARLRLLATLQLTLPGAPTIYYGDEVGLSGDTDPDDRRPFPWDSEDEALLSHYQALIHLRNQHSYLRTGSLDRLYSHNDDGTYAYGRKDANGAAVVALNRSNAGRGLTVDLTGYIPEGTVLTDPLGGTTYTVTGGHITLSLPGPGAAVLITPRNVDLTPPAAPDGLTAEEGDSRVSLSWSAVPGAAGYHVYRSYVTGGGYARLTSTPLGGASYADETAANGTAYYYVVTAVDAAGNESGRSNEVAAVPHLVIGWANLQWPPTLTHTISAVNPTADVYGQVWIDGCTNQPGATAGLLAQAGYGPAGSSPAGSAAWVWVDAQFNVDAGNNDEFKAPFLPEATGTFDYCYRYSTDGGRSWTYADQSGLRGDGTSPLAQPGVLTVNPSDDTTPPAAPANLHVTMTAATAISLAWDAVSAGDLFRYEVYRADAAGGPYTLAGTATDPSYSDGTVATGSTYYYVVRALDTSWNRSLKSNEAHGTAVPRTVHVTFGVTVPDWTPADATVHLAGNFPDNDWNPGGQAMTRVDATHWTITVDLPEGYALQYKYALGSWDYVEKGEDCIEIANRTATIAYGADGSMTLSDTVVNWRSLGTCPN